MQSNLTDYHHQHSLSSSQGVNDGAGAIILASEEAVKQHKFTPLARLLGWSFVGVDPSIMGIGPVPAIQNLLKVTGLKLDDIDLVEVKCQLCSFFTFKVVSRIDQ